MTDEMAEREAIGDYCRRVEDHLTRVNAGHLVRIVGPGFERVRHWARTGVPLSVVFRGIELKAERHHDGASKRPLRIEFCADDVEAVFEQWRRAVGVSALPGLDDAGTDAEPQSGEAGDSKRPSLKRHLDRVIDRLSRSLGRVDLPDALREACDPVLHRVAQLRDETKGARGDARDEAERTLLQIDQDLGSFVAGHAAPDAVAAADTEAREDLQPFRARLSGDDYDRALRVTRDRLLRARYGLPHVAL